MDKLGGKISANPNLQIRIYDGAAEDACCDYLRSQGTDVMQFMPHPTEAGEEIKYIGKIGNICVNSRMLMKGTQKVFINHSSTAFSALEVIMMYLIELNMTGRALNLTSLKTELGNYCNAIGKLFINDSTNGLKHHINNYFRIMYRIVYNCEHGIKPEREDFVAKYYDYELDEARTAQSQVAQEISKKFGVECKGFFRKGTEEVIDGLITIPQSHPLVKKLSKFGYPCDVKIVGEQARITISAINDTHPPNTNKLTKLKQIEQDASQSVQKS